MSASSNPIKIFPKDPDALLDYSIDWTEWLRDDVILTSVWTVPAGITDALESNSAYLTSIWLLGGTAGTAYSLVNRITTKSGRIEDRTITINVVER